VVNRLQGDTEAEIGRSGNIGGDPAIGIEILVEKAGTVIPATAKSVPVPAASAACPATTMLPSASIATAYARSTPPLKSVVAVPRSPKTEIEIAAAVVALHPEVLAG